MSGFGYNKGEYNIHYLLKESRQDWISTNLRQDYPSFGELVWTSTWKLQSYEQHVNYGPTLLRNILMQKIPNPSY